MVRGKKRTIRYVQLVHLISATTLCISLNCIYIEFIIIIIILGGFQVHNLDLILVNLALLRQIRCGSFSTRVYNVHFDVNCVVSFWFGLFVLVRQVYYKFLYIFANVFSTFESTVVRIWFHLCCLLPLSYTFQMCPVEFPFDTEISCCVVFRIVCFPHRPVFSLWDQISSWK